MLQPGLILFLFLTAPLLALAVSFFVRRLYRKSVSRLMRTESSQNLPAEPHETQEMHKKFAADRGTLNVEFRRPEGSAFIASPVLGLGAQYFVAGLVHGLVATITYFLLNEIEFLPIRTAIVWLVFSTPAVFFALYAMRLGFPAILAIGAVWTLILFLIEPESTVLLLILAGIPVMMGLLLINQKVGTVAPFLLIPAMFIMLGLVFSLDAALYGLTAFQSTTAILAGVIPVLFGIAAGAGYLAIIAGMSRRRRSSELMLQSDVLWLVVSGFETALQLTDHGWTALLMFLPFVAYRLVLAVLGAARRRDDASPRLLFLRVFGFQKRQAQLMRLLLFPWRQRGSLVMIGAADLALDTLDPPELLSFLRGRLRDLFISDPVSVDQSLAGTPQRAVDGLFPVEDFYCFNNAWQAAVHRLINKSQVVLMDLRGFSPSNMGCVFEIEQIFTRAEPECILLIIDSTTNQAFLKDCLQNAWTKRLAEPDNNAGTDSAKINLWEVESPRALKKLCRQILREFGDASALQQCG